MTWVNQNNHLVFLFKDLYNNWIFCSNDTEISVGNLTVVDVLHFSKFFVKQRQTNSNTKSVACEDRRLACSKVNGRTFF